MNNSERFEAYFNQILDSVKAGRSIDEAAKRLSLIVPDQSLIEGAVRLYRDRAATVWTLRMPTAVREERFEPWYVGPEDDDTFWPAYKRYLAARGWSPKQLDSLDGASTKALSLMPHPGEAVVSGRGLVVGYVQSGKTANFTAVISKAADVGYRLFIILSGLTDSLRNQTQERLDREIVNLNSDRWFQLTTHGEDFRQHGNVNVLLTERSQARIIGIVKKNAYRLRKLRDWLSGARPEVLNSCPTLVIDDEADQASPNSASDPERRTKINALLVELLGIVPKVAYVGYTATPFANVFIDPSSPEDLYPRDFIMHLPQPTGYFGPERLFGRDPVDWDEADEGADGLDMIRQIPDGEIASLKPGSSETEGFSPDVTPSLAVALNYFWMATAARHFRGQSSEHATMLVHTSQHIVVHNSFAQPLERYRQSVLRQLKSKPGKFLKQLREQWIEETNRVPAGALECTPVGFDELAPHLLPAVERTEIKIENSTSPDRIDYRSPGRIYVVVGGNVLARGLTLEGLTVSFFLRTASAYDTLLQMGRWFGFRQGYEDLPRVWMTDELKGYFYDLATVEKEIRSDIDRYKDGTTTPRELGVRVRTHPQLAITSKLKMQHAVHAKMSFADRSVQTTVFADEDRSWLDGNLRAARDLIAGLRADGLRPRIAGGRPHRILYGASVSRIVGFLDSYKIHSELGQMRGDLVKGYVELENSKGRLRNWNVGVVTRNENDYGTIDLGLDAELPLISRALFRHRGPNAADIKGLMSGIDDGLDLDLPRRDLAKLGREEVRGLRDRKLPDTGLLLLYPIFKHSPPLPKEKKRTVLDAVQHVIGLALVFPSSPEAPKVEYMTVDLSQVPREETDYDDEERVA